MACRLTFALTFQLPTITVSSFVSVNSADRRCSWLSVHRERWKLPGAGTVKGTVYSTPSSVLAMEPAPLSGTGDTDLEEELALADAVSGWATAAGFLGLVTVAVATGVGT